MALVPIVKVSTGELVAAGNPLSQNKIRELRDTLVPSLSLKGVLVASTYPRQGMQQLQEQPAFKGLFVREDTEQVRRELGIEPHSCLISVNINSTIDLSINYTEKEQLKKLMRKAMEDVRDCMIVFVGDQTVQSIGSDHDLTSVANLRQLDVTLVVPQLSNARYLVHRHTANFYGKVPMRLLLPAGQITPKNIREAVNKELPSVLLTMIENNLPYREVTAGSANLPQQNYSDRPVVAPKTATAKQSAIRQAEPDKRVYLLGAVLCVVVYVILKLL